MFYCFVLRKFRSEAAVNALFIGLFIILNCQILLPCFLLRFIVALSDSDTGKFLESVYQLKRRSNAMHLTTFELGSATEMMYCVVVSKL